MEKRFLPSSLKVSSPSRVYGRRNDYCGLSTFEGATASLPSKCMTSAGSERDHDAIVGLGNCPTDTVKHCSGLKLELWIAVNISGKLLKQPMAHFRQATHLHRSRRRLYRGRSRDTYDLHRKQ